VQQCTGRSVFVTKPIILCEFQQMLIESTAGIAIDSVELNPGAANIPPVEVHR
jgi:hypothetical protein